MSIAPERLLLLAAGAALVLAAAPGHRLHRVLAALLGARGAATLLPQASDDPAWAWAALQVQPYFALAIVPLAAYAMVLVRRAGRPAAEGTARPAGGWITALAVAALAVAYFVDHSLVQGLARGEAATSSMSAYPGIHYTGFGPLTVVAAAAPVAMAMLGLALAVAYRRARPHPTATPLLLLAVAFLVGPLFDASSRLGALASLLDSGEGFAWMPWGWALYVLPPLAALPALLGVALLAADRAVPGPRDRLEARLLFACGLAAFSGFVRLVFPDSANPAETAADYLLLGIWRLALPILVMAAVLASTEAAVTRREAAAGGLATLLAGATAAATAAAVASATAAPWPLLSALAVAVALALGARPLLDLSRRLVRAERAAVRPAPANLIPR